MGLKSIASGWFRRASARETAGGDGPPQRRVFVLNSLIGMPTSCRTRAHEGGPEEDLYLLDYNYIDRTKSLACVRQLAEARAARGLDFSSKTLLLAAKGLHPLADELSGLAHQFRTHYVFFELWNGLKEVVELSNARLEHLYYLPVSTRLQQVRAPRVPSPPNRRVFVSLGGDDDLDLIRSVIAQCPGLHFCLPNVSWAKPGSQKQFFDVQVSAANVTAVDCSPVRQHEQLIFSPQYRSAFDSCDTVLIATQPDKMFQLRGGVRFADALYARKHIVITENPMCQLLMAPHETTCLVAEHDPESVVRHLTRICAGEFEVAESVYEQIRALTVDDAKLSWMVQRAAHPTLGRESLFARSPEPLALARASLLARGRALLEREVQAVSRGSAADPARRGASSPQSRQDASRQFGGEGGEG